MPTYKNTFSTAEVGGLPWIRYHRRGYPPPPLERGISPPPRPRRAAPPPDRDQVTAYLKELTAAFKAAAGPRPGFSAAASRGSVSADG